MMSYRVAVASSDGKVVNQHFGRSRQFLIFDVTDKGEINFIEVRENKPPCGAGEHNENAMENTVNLLSDCSKVLVSQIGLGAEQALNVKGIRAYTVSDYIDNALKKLTDYEMKQKKY